MFPFNILTLILQIALLKLERSGMHRNSFLKDILKQGKYQNKRGKVWLL